MRIVAVLNQKGGVGKTTTAVNLGAALALRGRRVLLIDADPQGNLSDHLGIDPETVSQSIYDVLTDDVPLADATVSTETTGLFVVPSHADLAAAEQELAGEIGREMRLRRAMEKVPADTYDWVFIDCPPSLGLLSLNAMAVATALIVTVQTEYFAMRGLGQLDQTVQLVHEHVNPNLSILGILATLVSPVTKLAKEVIQEITGHYGDLVFNTRIRQNVRLAEAPGYQNHIFAYEPLSAGAEDYAALADEVEARVDASAQGEQPVTAQGADSDAAPAPPAPGAPNEAPAPAEGPAVDHAPPRDGPVADGRAAPRMMRADEAMSASPPSPGLHETGRHEPGRPPDRGTADTDGTGPTYDIARSGRIIMPPPRL